MVWGIMPACLGELFNCWADILASKVAKRSRTHPRARRRGITDDTEAQALAQRGWLCAPTERG